MLRTLIIELLSSIKFLFVELQSTWDWADHPQTHKEEALAGAFSRQVFNLFFLMIF